MKKEAQCTEFAKTGLTLPCVVKPCSGGSSIGVSIVRTEEEYEAALAEAFRYENEICLLYTSFRGFDDIFHAPHSREVGVLEEDVLKVPELELIADCEEGGPTILKTTDSKYFFALCHLEYDANTLALEYQRDLEKGINPHIPYNYFPDDEDVYKRQQ